MIKKYSHKTKNNFSDKHISETIKLPSQGKRLIEARQFVERLAVACGFSKSEIFDIKVSVGEACANAIEHGSPAGKHNNIFIKFEYENNCAVINVSDEGRFKARFPNLDSQLNYRGRGIPFMLALMDEVEIKEGDKGTTVRLVKLKHS